MKQLEINKYKFHLQVANVGVVNVTRSIIEVSIGFNRAPSPPYFGAILAPITHHAKTWSLGSDP